MAAGSKGQIPAAATRMAGKAQIYVNMHDVELMLSAQHMQCLEA